MHDRNRHHRTPPRDLAAKGYPPAAVPLQGRAQERAIRQRFAELDREVLALAESGTSPDEDLALSLIGPAPRTWARRSLADLLSVNGQTADRLLSGPSGNALKSEEFSETGVPVVMPRDFSGNVLDASQVSRVPEQVARRLAGYTLRDGDILLARRGDVARHALVEADHDGWICGTGCFRIRPADRVDPVYLMTYLSRPAVAQWLREHAQGSTVRSITIAALRDLPVLIPPKETQLKIRKAATLLKEHAKVADQVRVTEQLLRDALAADLSTGRIPG